MQEIENMYRTFVIDSQMISIFYLDIFLLKLILSEIIAENILLRLSRGGWGQTPQRRTSEPT